MQASNIVLIGFTSAGKSVTGKILAKKLGLGFTDVDDLIEHRYAMFHGKSYTCKDMYLELGEQKFREYESHALVELFERKNLVMSTGGGAPVFGDNGKLLCEWGTIVYISTRPETVYDRMQQRGGPPAYLEEGFGLENIMRHWKIRHPQYSAMADIIVDNSDKSIEETADLIAAELASKAKG